MIARCFGCRLPSSPWIAPLNNVDGGIIKLCGAVFVPPRATLICRHNGDDKRKRGKEREQVGLGKREKGKCADRLDKEGTDYCGADEIRNGDHQTGGLTAAAAIRSLVFWEGFGGRIR